MAFTFGFYNALNHDRLYDAVQVSQIFDGIISDGIYATYKEAMIVKASESDDTVVVGPGRGWFDHTWNYNDADLPIVGPESELISGMNRYDALVLDIQADESNRLNQILWVTGTPSATNPQKPTLINTTDRHQYPLCYIYRRGGDETINQADIENTIGTSECPFVSGIIDTIDLDDLLLQWKDQWAQFIADYEENIESWTQEQQDDFANMVVTYQNQMAAFQAAYGQEFTDWFASLQDILDEDTAGHLQNEIDDAAELEFLRYYDLFARTTTITDATGRIVSETSAAVMTTTITSSDGGDNHYNY